MEVIELKINTDCHRLSTYGDTYHDDYLPSCELCNMFDKCKREYMDTVTYMNDNDPIEYDTFRKVYLGKIHKSRQQKKLHKSQYEVKFIKISSHDIDKVRKLFAMVNANPQ